MPWPALFYSCPKLWRLHYETDQKMQFTSRLLRKRISGPSIRLFHYHLVCEDATRLSSYKSLEDSQGKEFSKANILITDPPYCLLERKKLDGGLRDEKLRNRKTDNRSEVPRFANLSSYREFTVKWLSLALKHGLQSNTPLIIWSNPLGKKIITDVCKEFKYDLVGEYLWLKKSSDNKGTQETLLRCYESALVFSSHRKNNRTSDPEDILLHGKTVKSYTLPWSVVSGYHGTTTTVSSSSSSSTAATAVPHNHPCHKPVVVLKPLISTWTRPGDVVLDPFSGSGAVALAIRELGEGRSYLGIEVLNDWVEQTRKTLSTSGRQTT
jgi:site-specific DNA-methyltransferase (adenine-specific)